MTQATDLWQQGHWGVNNLRRKAFPSYAVSLHTPHAIRSGEFESERSTSASPAMQVPAPTNCQKEYLVPSANLVKIMTHRMVQQSNRANSRYETNDCVSGASAPASEKHTLKTKSEKHRNERGGKADDSLDEGGQLSKEEGVYQSSPCVPRHLHEPEHRPGKSDSDNEVVQIDEI
ncbi:hypothetical protein EJB05_35774 [Eragrostis curvula]|uniref:Uncharacterized protein n=1 Tax=Eragrostis curvula TaxID=38414 RepID=A0A5J9U7M5_9POAL|nr:hypothetical protein EJB05_35774 [Eragrostis curvula]